MEVVDLITLDNTVVGTATKDECHAKGLLHRSVFVFLFDEQKRMIVQQRSSQKKLRPHKVTAAACGHVLAGERVENAARRELEEELGLSIPLQFCMKTIGPYDDDRELIFLFVGTTDMRPAPNPNEIDKLLYLTCGEIRQAIDAQSVNFGASFKKVFAEYVLACEALDDSKTRYV
jgi:isopentenyl-diphosphate delta-isomerase